jgi:hypothetical protein
MQAEGTLKLVLQCPHLPIKVHSVQADSSTVQCTLLCHQVKDLIIKEIIIFTDLLKLLRLIIYVEITCYTPKKFAKEQTLFLNKSYCSRFDSILITRKFQVGIQWPLGHNYIHATGG